MEPIRTLVLSQESIPQQPPALSIRAELSGVGSPKALKPMNIAVFFATNTPQCVVLDLKDIKQRFEDFGSRFGLAKETQVSVCSYTGWVYSNSNFEQMNTKRAMLQGDCTSLKISDSLSVVTGGNNRNEVCLL